MVQWSILPQQGACSVPGWGTRTLHAMWCNQKEKKQNKTKEKAQQQKQKGKKQIDEINLNDIFYLTQYNQRITMAT